jgi:hypothetical protein
MPPDLSTISDRVAALHAAAAGDVREDGVLAAIEDALTAGYAWALDGDAWSIATEDRLHELMCDPAASGELGALAAEHAAFQRDLITLRRALSELWRDRDRLRADSRAVA